MPSEAIFNFKFGSLKIVKKMYGNKKFAKRSAVGARVCGAWQDNIYYPGVIRSVNAKPTGETWYTLEFTHGYVKDLTESQIVGTGFLDVANIHLKFNQQVFVTHLGKEVLGYVQKHRKQTNEVFIKLTDANETLVRRKPDDVRLLPTRKPRLINNDTNCTHNGDCEPESKKRTVSGGIEVPCAKTARIERGELEPQMDEVMAAMILTSLSGSPLMDTGPISPNISDTCSLGNVSPSPSTSSGQFSWDIQSRGTPSPGLQFSDVEFTPLANYTYNSPPHGTPVESMPGTMMFSSSLDEGIDMSEGSLQFSDDLLYSPKKLKNPLKTLYKCTWQGCSKTLCTVQGIERHIRVTHLGKRDNEFSDHEEEFYYTEIESTLEAVSDTFASMMTSSPPPLRQDVNGNHIAAEGNRFSFQKLNGINNIKSRPTQGALSAMLSSPSALTAPGIHESSFKFHSIPTSTSTCVPVHQPNSQYISSYDRQKAHFLPQRPNFQVISPAKSHVQQPRTLSPVSQAKIRAEGRKCRKVYGMENRELWCTQCKWKKACTRFL